MSGSPANGRVSVPASPESLARIRRLVLGLAREAGLAEKEAGELEQAVDEACANVIEHAYAGREGEEIGLAWSLDPDAVTIRVRDSGRPFDATALPDEELATLVTQRRRGGLGMRIIRALSDDVRYQSGPGPWNELSIRKRRKREQPG